MMTFLKKLFKKDVDLAREKFEVELSGNKKAKRVLIFTEHVNATYYISFDIPLRELHAQGKVNFAVVSQQYVTAKGEHCWHQWYESFKPDVVVMTRYALPFGAEILEYFKSRKVPVIYHIDDNLLEIPESLGAEIQKRQGAEQVVAARRYMLEHCDLIYASTSYLKDLFQGLFPKQEIYHGMYAPYMGEKISALKQVRNQQTIGYMGSKGHQEDLELVVPALEQLLNTRPDLSFEVFGTIRMPTSLERFGDRVKSHKVNKGYADFLSILAQLNWDVGLAPLVNDKFNLCKAPTKYIEYTAAGIPVIASNIPVYSKVIPEGGGVLVDVEWRSAIENLLESKQSRDELLSISQAYCREKFSTTILEQQVLDVLNRVKVK
ncbi:glycosyltransferase involved in cell wall biosynthesis [Pseudomonas sp. BT76 TE3572]|uniref:Glycosyl transferase family 1 n=1 Tax=Pseudomonas mandelii PD30 TaxID=1419583 RepID=A0A059KVJ9_9PSED|nr:glycosyltransferase [Pseudomonas mandelii]KDD66082.1 hypothetical protein V466_26060 [Pseudomonas mandelii PD30]